MCDAASDLAEAYLLFDEPRFARACRLVLLQLAEVYPHWLVHSGYGENWVKTLRAAIEVIANPLDDDKTSTADVFPDTTQ